VTPSLTRRNVSWLLLCLLAVVTVDQVTKQWATGHSQIFENAGVMAGFFSDLPPLLRTVSVSTLGAFVLFAYGFLQLLIPVKTLILRFGLTFYTGAILGNIADRVFRGSIIDFVVLPIPFAGRAAFNIADFFQWIGLALILYAIVRDHSLLWPDNNLRVRNLVMPRFQKRYDFVLTGSVAICLLVLGIFSYAFLRSTLIDSLAVDAQTARKILHLYLLFFGAILLICLVSIKWLARIVSNRAAGPVYSFNRFVHQLIDGKLDPRAAKFRLRKNDDFLELEALGNSIAQALADKKTEKN
jgi:signal peptidase II